MDEYFNYWDVTQAAVKSVNKNYIFGGPGGNLLHRHDKSYGWNLLEHVITGTNYWTNQTGGSIDFIATHCKGTTIINGQRAARTETIMNSEKQVIGTESGVQKKKC